MVVQIVDCLTHLPPVGTIQTFTAKKLAAISMNALAGGKFARPALGS